MGNKYVQVVHALNMLIIIKNKYVELNSAVYVYLNSTLYLYNVVLRLALTVGLIIPYFFELDSLIVSICLFIAAVLSGVIFFKICIFVIQYPLNCNPAFVTKSAIIFRHFAKYSTTAVVPVTIGLDQFVSSSTGGQMSVFNSGRLIINGDSSVKLECAQFKELWYRKK